MTKVRALLLSLAAVGVSLMGACTGDQGRLSKAEYEEKVRAVYAEVQEAFQRTNVASLDERADRVEDAQAELREAASALESREPPEDAEAANLQIAQGMRAYADDLELLREAAERGDEGAVEAFNARIGQNRSVKLIAEAAESLKFKGYDLGQIAEE
jgi:hypothetical protein